VNEFESRYYPLKRAFDLRSEKFHRADKVRTETLRFKGNILTALQVFLPAPDAAVKGKRLIYSSDWHWHDSSRNRRLLDEYTELCQKFPADIQLLGGDLCDDADTLDKLPYLLSHLSPLAPVTIAANGNWEAGKRWLKPDYFAGLYAANRITSVENSSVICGKFRITVLPDVSSIDFRYLPELEKIPDITDILLTHNPDGVVAADRKGFLRNFSLVLCGHTHGGQCRLPLFGAIYIPSFYHRKFDRGVFERRGLNLKMIVSSGIGEHRHTRRFLCPPQAVIVEFK
jgi:predicted MPP superfamily phosphohydrolase